MPPELHLHPDRLRGHAITAADLSEELRAVLGACGGEWPAAERGRLLAVTTGAVRELAELSAVLAAVAADAAAADADAARAVHHLVPPDVPGRAT
jgi:hypothetical protein